MGSTCSAARSSTSVLRQLNEWTKDCIQAPRSRSTQVLTKTSPASEPTLRARPCRPSGLRLRIPSAQEPRHPQLNCAQAAVRQRKFKQFATAHVIGKPTRRCSGGGCLQSRRDAPEPAAVHLRGLVLRAHAPPSSTHCTVSSQPRTDSNGHR